MSDRSDLEARVVLLEERVERLEIQSEGTDRHNVAALAMAAEARGIALGKRAHSTAPPMARWLAGVMDHFIGRAIVIVVAIVVGYIVRWLSVH